MDRVDARDSGLDDIDASDNGFEMPVVGVVRHQPEEGR